MTTKSTKSNPNWPSKNPDKSSGSDRGNNPPKTPSKPAPAPPKKK